LQPSRLIGVRAGVAVLAAFAALAWQPAVGSASQKVIKSPGSPLSSIYVDEDLGCQVQANGDAHPSFFGGTEPGACGTFLAITEAEGSKEAGSPHLFGPKPPEGAVPERKFHAFAFGEPPSIQELSGSGTEKNPFVITSEVGAYEGAAANEHDVAELTEEDSYVTGQDFYTTKITVRNSSGEPLEGTLYHAGDCSLADNDSGYGAENMPAKGSVACTVDPDGSSPGRFMAFTPIATEGFPVSSAHFAEGLFSKVWSNVSGGGAQFPDTVETTTSQNNGMGLSWPISLESEDPATVSFTTTVSPTAPPTSSSSAGACVANGPIPVTVSAANGAKAVDYAVDGGAVQSVATNVAGEASIALAPGVYSIEYWGEDLTGAQEATHHQLNVTVGAPGLTIASAQGHSSYEQGEAASVTVTATGIGPGSTATVANVAIPTTTPGSFTVTRSETDACGTTQASFAYTVLSPPTLGKNVNVYPVSGQVFIALPVTGHASLAGLADPLEAAIESLSKGLKFIPLTEARQIPLGSVLDTVAGVARVTTATASVGKLQFGDFGAGIFKLLQARKQKGLAELDIMDAHSARQVCATLGKRAAVAAKLSSKVLGRLNANAHGKFSTKGQYSAATVRGTVWSVANQCDGTLTKVQRGVVSVRDFVRRKTITLFTGQHYLARP
jgi:hypothetical protein